VENLPPPQRISNKVPRRTMKKKAGKVEYKVGLVLQEEGRWKRVQEAQTLEQIQKEYWKGMKDFENMD
jgi:hypothetical protein